jgi:glyoxylase-like metal-dependent hydrolase (beta-lactamase superfamily II)
VTTVPDLDPPADPDGLLPPTVRLVRAPNRSPMTLDGTNTYLLRTASGVVVVDPGPALPEHLDVLAAGDPVLLVVLTHGHLDHAEGAPDLHDRTGAPVTAADPALCRGGADPLPVSAGRGGRRRSRLDVDGLAIDVLAAPGHTADSVCLLATSAASDAALLLTGDTILGRGTTVVAHPDGRLGDYLDTLSALASLDEGGARVHLLPGHGPVRSEAATRAREYLAHRAERLGQVRAARAAGAVTARDVVEIVYADVERALWPAAELSVRAQLDYLDDRAAAGED